MKKYAILYMFSDRSSVYQVNVVVFG